MARKCATCDEPTLTPRHKYCGPCRDAAEARYAQKNRSYASKRGRRIEDPERRAARRAGRYGAEHGRQRKEWAPRVAAGEVCCSRCGLLIEPGKPWHLDHQEDGPSLPSHPRCNMAAATGIPLTPKRLEEMRQYRKRLANPEKLAALYGDEHQRLRKAWTEKVAAGGVSCMRCLEPIRPGDPWDLGHDDRNPELYTGPEHPSCNRRAGGRRTSRRWQSPTVTSRNWFAASG